MSAKPYIAEFHDIAKLLDKEKLKDLGFVVRGQRFDDIDFGRLGLPRPTCPSWYAPYSDGLRSLGSKQAVELGEWAPKVLLTRIADEIASSFRLVPGEKPDVLAGYRKVWKAVPEAAEQQGHLIADLSALSSLLDFWANCDSAQQFFERYDSMLEELPEDKSVPYNITSLRNHLMLVGKLARVLEGGTRWDGQQISLGSSKVSQVEQATGSRVSEEPRRGQWLGTLAFIRVDFPQTLVRLSDLNVLVSRQRAINATRNKFPDHILYSTPDSFLAFLPEQGPLTLESLLAVVVEEGFVMQMKTLQAELGLLASDFGRQYDQFHAQKLADKRTLRLVEQPFSREESWPLEIRGRLCEVCQLRESRSLPWAKDQVEEWLCDTCTGIREMHQPATEVASWTEAVIWARVSLDRDNLLESLRDLFRAYVREALPSAGEDQVQKYSNQFRPFTPEIDFIQDYLEFSDLFQARVVGDVTRTGLGFAPVPWAYTLEGYPELTVCPVVSNQEFLVVCRSFIKLMRSMFPRCVTYSPLGLGLSLSAAKHPYQDHWRFLTGRHDPSRPLRVRRANDFEFRLTIPQFEALDGLFSQADPPTSAALHRLAAIERSSHSPSAVLFEAFGDDRLRPLVRPLLFEHQLPMETVLNFYKLTSWQGESHAAHDGIL